MTMTAELSKKNTERFIAHFLQSTQNQVTPEENEIVCYENGKYFIRQESQATGKKIIGINRELLPMPKVKDNIEYWKQVLNAIFDKL